MRWCVYGVCGDMHPLNRFVFRVILSVGKQKWCLMNAKIYLQINLHPAGPGEIA